MEFEIAQRLPRINLDPTHHLDPFTIHTICATRTSQSSFQSRHMYPTIPRALVAAIVLVFLVLSVLLPFKFGAFVFDNRNNPSHSPHIPVRQAQELKAEVAIEEPEIEVVTDDNFCPILRAIWDGESWGDGFVVGSQDDADQLKRCHTFRGYLFIAPWSARQQLIIDGPVMIIGKLRMSRYLRAPPLEYVSMPSLKYVLGSLAVDRWHLNSGKQMPDFPNLKYVSDKLSISGDHDMDKINFPALEKVGWLSITNQRTLHTITAPKLHSARVLEFTDLPSLENLSIFTSLKGPVGQLNIVNTGLTRMEDLWFDRIGGLSISQNKNLTTITFPYLTSVVLQSPREERNITATIFPRRPAMDLRVDPGEGNIHVSDNHDFLILNLPGLRQVTRVMEISGLHQINIPSLERVGELAIGASSTERRKWKGPCKNCFQGHLGEFFAPMLRHVEGDMTFDNSWRMESIKLPMLESVADIRINNTAALDRYTGIRIPRLRHAENVHVVGLAPYCSIFERLHCRGVIAGRYSCHSLDQYKQVAGEQNACYKDELEPESSCPGRVSGRLCWIDRLEEWTEMFQTNCDENLEGACLSEYVGRVKFVARILALSLLLIPAILKYAKARGWIGAVTYDKGGWTATKQGNVRTKKKT